jgi:hypothetical protein
MPSCPPALLPSPSALHFVSRPAAVRFVGSRLSSNRRSNKMAQSSSSTLSHSLHRPPAHHPPPTARRMPTTTPGSTLHSGRVLRNRLAISSAHGRPWQFARIDQASRVLGIVLTALVARSLYLLGTPYSGAHDRGTTVCPKRFDRRLTPALPSPATGLTSKLPTLALVLCRIRHDLHTQYALDYSSFARLPSCPDALIP